MEVDPSPTQKISFTLDKTCNANDQATWKVTFDLQEGNPLATVFKLAVQIDPENNPQAQATLDKGGLDATQQGQAQIAAAVAKDPTATEGDKQAAISDVIAVKEMSATAGTQ